MAYSYDTSSISGNQNTKGRLTSATIMNGSNVISQVSPYNYDPMGRVQDIQECVPTSATACANRLLTYGYNQAGNVDSMTNNAASPVFTLTSTYDGADQLSLVTSSLNTGNYPGTLFEANSTSSSDPSYGPVGLMNASLGIPQSGVPMATISRTYDNRAQVTGETDMAGSQTVYYYSIPAYNKSNPSASGYDAAGNIVSMSDSVMGTWDYGYDTLNRLTSASAIAGSYSSLAMSWTIDPFGNRTAQNVSGSPSQPVPQPWSAVMSSGNNNRIAHSSPPGANWTYDAGGNVTFDGTNYYLYDGTGRLCAVDSPGTPSVMTGYLYDGNGNRIAKGTLTSFSCNLASNGFSLTDSYVVGKDGEQLTEFQGSTPVHTNVFADGKLLATYASSQTYFDFTDWLGTKRAEIGAGCTSTYASLPYGDELTLNGNCLDATEHHYTGKEHDAESGNDYFGARYYASVTGRFTSPDYSDEPEALPFADLDNPQSLNAYGYVGNNPISVIDEDGHSQDTYVADVSKHGGPHIDRYNKAGQNVGRYTADGTPIEHSDRMPPPIPKSDKGKFEKAKQQLEKKIKQKEAADANSSGPTKMQQFQVAVGFGAIMAMRPFLPMLHGAQDFQHWLNNLSIPTPPRLRVMPPPPPIYQVTVRILMGAAAVETPGTIGNCSIRNSCD